MENFIFSYLTENFYLGKSKVGNWGIYLGPEVDDNLPFRGHKLISEISSVFGLDEKTAKRLINKWAKPADLKFYWKTGIDLSNLVFPEIRTMANFTIAHDLVEVQPMSAPNPTFMFLDSEYVTTASLQEAYNNSTQPMMFTYVESGKTK